MEGGGVEAGGSTPRPSSAEEAAEAAAEVVEAAEEAEEAEEEEEEAELTVEAIDGSGEGGGRGVGAAAGTYRRSARRHQSTSPRYEVHRDLDVTGSSSERGLPMRRARRRAAAARGRGSSVMEVTCREITGDHGRSK